MTAHKLSVSGANVYFSIHLEKQPTSVGKKDVEEQKRYDTFFTRNASFPCAEIIVYCMQK